MAHRLSGLEQCAGVATVRRAVRVVVDRVVEAGTEVARGVRRVAEAPAEHAVTGSVAITLNAVPNDHEAAVLVHDQIGIESSVGEIIVDGKFVSTGAALVSKRLATMALRSGEYHVTRKRPSAVIEMDGSGT
jgi:hypothetical protein